MNHMELQIAIQSLSEVSLGKPRSVTQGDRDKLFRTAQPMLLALSSELQTLANDARKVAIADHSSTATQVFLSDLQVFGTLLQRILYPNEDSFNFLRENV